MNSEAILQSDPLDILFDKRNKAYGAYMLRKFYPHRIKKSLCSMFGIVALFSAFTFFPERKAVNMPFINDSVVVRSIPLDKELNKPLPPKRWSLSKAQRIFTSGFIIKQDTDSTDSLQSIDDIPVGLATVAGISVEYPGDQSLPDDGEQAPLPAPVNISGTENNVVDDPDVPASFPGGEKELRRFLQKNLASPRELEEGEMIEVRIKYVVGYDGNLQSFEIVKDGGGLFNNEVVRVLKKMPKWNPGKKGSRDVSVYYTIPVKFMAIE